MSLVNPPAIILHPKMSISTEYVGRDKQPLLVIDNLLANAAEVKSYAQHLAFVADGVYYPGIRVNAPLAYQQAILSGLLSTLIDTFALTCSAMQFSLCQYSLVTTPPEQLQMAQRIPHMDSIAEQELAMIHYLWDEGYGGTSFYRHKKTGYEYIDRQRQANYFAVLGEQGQVVDNLPPAEYINGDTLLFERVKSWPARFNRALIYRKTSLHSGDIAKDFKSDSNPLTGRLSINSFLEPC
ncbi:DUF6445 family protein [Alteromonadaceae bacterium BrNp21-10]|nr:DUF6445 family protein [Alteromonadaceae bacterium BrNp21-10]